MPSDPQAVLARSYNDCDCVPGHKCDCWELKDLFDLQQTRMEAATKLWRERNPGNDLVLPDLGRLLDWMARALAESEKRVRVLTEAVAVLMNAADDWEAQWHDCRCEWHRRLNRAVGIAANLSARAALSEPETPRWVCDWTPDELNPGPECPYCADRMCARFDGLDGCHHSIEERHGEPETPR